METLTRELLDAHLLSFVEILSEPQSDNVVRFAWTLSEMAAPSRFRSEPEARELCFEFVSHETARNFAFGWLRRHRPDLVDAAKKEALEGIRYRAAKTKT